MRAEANNLRDAGIEPAERIWKRKRMQALDLVIFADCDQSRAAVGSVIQGENEGTGKIGRVKSASGVTEMMIEIGKTASGEKLTKTNQRGLVLGVFAVILSCRCAPIRERYYADIGQAQAGRSENACEGELRKGVRIVAATELFFFDCSKDIVVIEERNGCAGARSGDAEGVHAADFRGVRSQWRLMVALQTPG